MRRSAKQLKKGTQKGMSISAEKKFGKLPVKI
jgi:hypothetical protein